MGKRELVLGPQAGVGGSLGACPAGKHKQTWALDHAPSHAVAAARVLAVSPWPQMWWPWPAPVLRSPHVPLI